MSFALPIFPEGSLASSVITTTWIGVMVVAFFNLRFGWVLSGLVVPGYLVPLLFLRPWAVVVVLLESVATYAIVWVFSELLSRAGYWGRLFGRDRFLALLLCSVAVRLVSDAWVLPAVAAYVGEHYNQQFEYASDLHSFGLIIIALVANQLWKTGPARGVQTLVITVGTTFLIVRYGLMEFTNFHITALSFLYEDVASSILASPKAYIILLTTAFLASRMNLRYGLDHGGILIPALVALQWFQPLKVATTIAEAFVIYFVALALLRLPMLAGAALDGARKLVLFFSIAFAYKMALGFLIPWLAPETKVTDFFGFGYLLATMLAMTMHDKMILPRVTRATLQTSLVGAVAASIIGFGITVLFEPVRLFGAPLAQEAGATHASDGSSLTELLDRDRVAFYRARLSPGEAAPAVWETAAFIDAVRLIQRRAEGGDGTILADARRLLSEVGYDAIEIDGRYVYLRDARPGTSRGVYIVDRQAAAGPLLEVPVPMEGNGLATAGLTLFKELQGRALAVAGAEWTATSAIGREALTDADGFFQAFHRLMARDDVVQLRALQDATDPASGSLLSTKSTLPRGLDRKRLEQLIGQVGPQIGGVPTANLQRQSAASGFAELFVDATAVRRLVLRDEAKAKTLPLHTTSLSARMLAMQRSIGDRETASRPPPTLDELLFFDREVLTEIVRVIEDGYRRGAWSAEGLERLAVAAASARVLGYQLERLRDDASGAEFLVLRDEQPSRTGDRGSYVFRLGDGQPFIVEVSPLLEGDVTAYATRLFERLGASALLIGGSPTSTNTDDSNDPIARRDRHSVFNLVQQVLLRESGRGSMMVVQCRALRPIEKVVPDFQVIVSLDDGAMTAEELSPLATRLAARLSDDGLQLRFNEGSSAVAGDEVAERSRLTYLGQAWNKEFAVLWLGPGTRLSASPAIALDEDRPKFDALGIATEATAVASYLAEHGTVADQLPVPEVRQTMRSYRATRDVVLLQLLRDRTLGVRLVHLIDTATSQPFLAFLDAATGRVAALANLQPTRDEEVSRISDRDLGSPAVDAVLRSGAGWIAFSRES